MRFLRTSSLSWILSALAVIGYASAEAQTVFPGEAWEYVEKEALENHGWSAEVLAKTTEFIRDESNTTGLVIVDRGRVVYRYGDIDELSYVASVRKSLLAMLYGYWVENGIIDLETTLEELGMDDIGGLLPIEKKATAEHLIKARSGVYHPASYSGDDLDEAPPRGSQQPCCSHGHHADFAKIAHCFLAVGPEDSLRERRGRFEGISRTERVGRVGDSGSRWEVG